MAKKKAKDKKPVGAPTKFTQQLADSICLEISTSNKSLRTICKDLKINVISILRWLSDTKHPEFCTQYARAKEEQADFLAEEMLEIADDSTRDTKQITTKGGEVIDVEDTEWTNRSKLRIETRKWIASKLKPKKYGDRIQTDLTAEIKGDIKITLNLD